MLRVRKIVPKTDILNIALDVNNAKIEILQSDQKFLKDPNVCSVYVYKRVDWSLICGIIGACEKATSHQITKEQDLGFVKGIVSMKMHGYITKSHLDKLGRLEKEYKYSFNIAKSLKQLSKSI